MIKINIIGSYFGMTGYDIHTKMLSNALNNLKDVEVSVLCNKPQNWYIGLEDKEFKMLKRSNEDSEYSIFIGLPSMWPLYMSEDKKFIGFCIWEGDKIPAGWLDILKNERLFQIWVPSNHVKQAIENTTKDKNILKKIRIVPHGVDTKLFYPKTNRGEF